MKVIQICFPADDGYMICNCIMRNGECVETKSGRWWKFLLSNSVRRRKQKSPKDESKGDSDVKTFTA